MVKENIITEEISERCFDIDELTIVELSTEKGFRYRILFRSLTLKQLKKLYNLIGYIIVAKET